MADTYDIEKAMVLNKSVGASKGRGDERDKAGDVKEEGEQRAKPLEGAAVPGENKKEIAPTEGKLPLKENPAGSPIGATAGQGDERDKAGDLKEAGEKRAKPILKSEDEESIGKALFDEKLEAVAKSLKGMKYIYPNQVLLVRGMLDKRIDSIATELKLEKSLVGEVVYRLFDAKRK